MFISYLLFHSLACFPVFPLFLVASFPLSHPLLCHIDGLMILLLLVVLLFASSPIDGHDILLELKEFFLVSRHVFISHYITFPPPYTYLNIALSLFACPLSSSFFQFHVILYERKENFS
jgi:hypothetical protein